jgi:hypothetical protein
MKYYPGDDHEHGLDIEIPAGTDVEGLIAAWGTLQSKIGRVSVDGNPAKSDDRLPDNAVLNLYQPIWGDEPTVFYQAPRMYYFWIMSGLVVVN